MTQLQERQWSPNRCPRFIVWMTFGIMIVGCPAFAAEVEPIPLPDPLPSEIEEIDLTYVPDRALPSVELKLPGEQPLSIPYRPTAQNLDLLPLSTPRLFGSCSIEVEHGGHGVRISKRSGDGGHCGVIFPLIRDRKPLDVLSYGYLHVKGEVIGGAAIGLADEEFERREDTALLGSVSGSFDVQLSLTRTAKTLDLRRLTRLVLLLDAEAQELILEEGDFKTKPSQERGESRVGFWVWNYIDVSSNSTQLFKSCLNSRCSRLTIQIPAATDDPPVWQAYTDLLRAAAADGIETYALDGYPEAIQDPELFTDKIMRLMESVPAGTLPGVQLDVEPYLLPGFLLDKTGPQCYLDLLDRVKQALGKKAKLSVVVPFWFTSILVHGRPLAFSVMDRADEVAVMSYRTDMRELSVIAEDWLRYGDAIDVPVWLAVETTRLPEEHHVVLHRERHPTLADAYVDRNRRRLILERPRITDGAKEAEWFRIHHRVTVKPGTITFAGQSRHHIRRSITSLTNQMPNPSFEGVMIHDMAGFQALAE